MKNRLMRSVGALFIACVLLCSIVPPVQAQRSNTKEPDITIPEDDQSWGGLPWIIGVVLGGGCIVASLKNAKRSHMD